MAFGIPNSQDLSDIIKTGISQAQSAGVALEDHEAQILHDQIIGQLSPILDFASKLPPELDRFATVAETLPAAISQIVAVARSVDKFVRAYQCGLQISPLNNLPPSPPKE